MTSSALRRADAPAFDQAKAEAFAGKLLSTLNSSALALMISIGHRTHLFDSLALITPATSGALATKAKLTERYVREWLSAMTTAGIVTYDSASEEFDLPAEHIAFLTRDAAPNNIAANMQMIAVAAGVEDEIVEHFADGHGVHYHEYGRFHEVLAEHTAQAIVMNLPSILSVVDGAREQLEAGIDVVDVGCGAGGVLMALAEAYPRSRFTGLDLSPDAFAPAIAEVKRKGLTNLAFREADIGSRPSFGNYDLVISIDAVHDQRDPQEVLRTVRRSLKAGGSYLMVEIGGSSKLEKNIEHPLGTYLYMMSTMHCTPVSLVQGGVGLGTMWGVELAGEMLAKAGFSKVSMTRLPHDLFNAYFIARA